MHILESCLYHLPICLSWQPLMQILMEASRFIWISSWPSSSGCLARIWMCINPAVVSRQWSFSLLCSLLNGKLSQLVSSVFRDHTTSLELDHPRKSTVVFYTNATVTMSSSDGLLEDKLFQDDESVDNVIEKPPTPLYHRRYFYRPWFLPFYLHLALIISYSAIFTAIIYSYSSSRSHGPGISYSKHLP